VLGAQTHHTRNAREVCSRFVSDRDIGRALAATTALVALLGVGSELGHYVFGAPILLVDLLSLSVEGNVPTWYATCLLFACGEALLRVAHATSAARAPFARHWWALGLVFLFMSLDEAIEIHEHLAYVVEGRGVFYFSWVIPAFVVVVALGLAYLRFLSHLASEPRRRFLIAGALYVTGALLFELPLGLWTERHGDDNLGYALIDAAEETLELVGATYFLLALRAYRPPTSS
jgi:hypothetical protein